MRLFKASPSYTIAQGQRHTNALDIFSKDYSTILGKLLSIFGDHQCVKCLSLILDHQMQSYHIRVDQTRVRWKQIYDLQYKGHHISSCSGVHIPTSSKLVAWSTSLLVCLKASSTLSLGNPMSVRVATSTGLATG